MNAQGRRGEARAAGAGSTGVKGISWANTGRTPMIGPVLGGDVLGTQTGRRRVGGECTPKTLLKFYS